MNIGDDSDYDYEADRRDAERYRWLRDNKATAMLANMREHIKAPWVDPEPALDAAVDHALGVQGASNDQQEQPR